MAYILKTIQPVALYLNYTLKIQQKKEGDEHGVVLDSLLVIDGHYVRLRKIYEKHGSIEKSLIHDLFDKKRRSA